MRTKEQVLRTMLFEKPFALQYAFRRKNSGFTEDKEALQQLVKEGLIELEEKNAKHVTYRYIGTMDYRDKVLLNNRL